MNGVPDSRVAAEVVHAQLKLASLPYKRHANRFRPGGICTEVITGGCTNRVCGEKSTSTCHTYGIVLTIGAASHELMWRHIHLCCFTRAKFVWTDSV